jgi:6-phosphogluconolactonase (cycloisomerase 2 family)
MTTPPVTPDVTQELYVAGHGAGPEFGLQRFQLRDGAWTGTQLAEVPALSALARHPSAPVVYGVSGTPEEGRLHAWRVDGPASALGEVSTGGGEPCHLAVDPEGRWLVVANYATSSLAVCALADDGSLLEDPRMLPLSGNSVDPDRQEAAHPHQVVLDGDVAYVVDLGADVVRVLAVRSSPDAGEVLTPRHEVAVPTGTGPRHLARLRDGLVALSGELESTVLTGRLDAPGAEWSVAPSTGRGPRPQGPYERNYPSDIAASPDRRLVYLANRGHDTVSTYDIASGRPVHVGEVDAGGRWPQHLLVQGEDLLVATRDSDQVCALTLEDGVPTTARVLFACPGATWLLP